MTLRPAANSASDTPLALPPLPALVRFIISALWCLAAFWLASFVYAFFPHRALVPGLLYRLLACLLVLAGFVFFLRVLDLNFRPLTAALSFPFDRTAGRQLSTGFAAGALLITADALVIALGGSLHFHLHLTPHMLVRALGVLLLLFCGALLEELSFRGYPFQKLTEAVGAVWAVVFLGILFSALHLGNPNSEGFLSWGFFNTLAIGLILALIRIRTGSLWFCFGLHYGWNLFQGLVLGLPVSGLREFAALITTGVAGPRSLTGGDYGPEASATCAIILVLSVPFLWRLTGKRSLQHRQAVSVEDDTL